MDAFVDDPPKQEKSKNHSYKPYIRQQMRDMYKNSSQKGLLKNVSVHVPYSVKEENKILTYCAIQRFRNQSIPVNMIPYQLMRENYNPSSEDFKVRSINRNYQSIMNYLSDVVTFKSPNFIDDIETPQSIQLKCFETDISGIPPNYQQDLDQLTISPINHLYFAMFFQPKSPLLVKTNGTFPHRRLFNNQSSFTTVTHRIFCTNYRNSCCIYECNLLTFFDLRKCIKYVSNFSDEEVQTFSNWSIPCEIIPTQLIGYPYKDIDENVFIFAGNSQDIEGNDCIFVWKCNLIFHEYERFKIIVNSNYFRWLKGQRLLIICENNNDIKIFDYNEKKILTFYLAESHDILNCDGEALVLRVRNKKADHLKVIPFSSLTPLSLDVGYDVEFMAFCAGNLLFITSDRKIHVWNTVIQHRDCGVLAAPCVELRAIPELDIFLAITNRHYVFLDKFGQIIKEFQMDGVKHIMFDKENMYALTLGAKGFRIRRFVQMNDNLYDFE